MDEPPLHKINGKILKLLQQSKLVYPARDGKIYCPFGIYHDVTLYAEVLAHLLLLEACIVIRKNKTARTGHEYADAIKKHFGIDIQVGDKAVT